MSYVIPDGGAVNATWQGAPAYVAPPGNAVNVVWEPNAVTGVAAVTLEITAAAEGAHSAPSEQEYIGVAAATLDITAAASGVHGVAGSAGATLTIGAVASGAHGVSGVGECTLPFTADVVAVHVRFEVRGEVRQGGVLVNRRVRAHRRDTGELVGEGDTVAGRFHVHTGFAAREHYLVPLDLAVGATDWTPPVANHVVSVLAQDA
jgi:hypothetical protein